MNYIIVDFEMNPVAGEYKEERKLVRTQAKAKGKKFKVAWAEHLGKKKKLAEEKAKELAEEKAKKEDKPKAVKSGEK